MVKPQKLKMQLVTYGTLGLIALIVGLGTYQLFAKPKTPKLPHPPLKELAQQHDIALGNFAIANHLNHKAYTDILTTQFDYALADNTPNWYFTDGGLRPSPTEYNFTQMDQVVGFAESHNMEVEAHHFVWGEEKWLPAWLKEGNYNKEQLLKLIEDHITTVGQRYSGRIETWTVVNEAFTRGQHLYDLRDWWADNTGDQEYIDKSFIWARQADPSATLILNDFHNESINDTSNAMYDYVKGALKRGVPIDGIGMQMHIDGGHPPTKDEVISNMKRFADLGLGVYVTEFDINMNDLQTNAHGKDQIQANIYYEMMRACIESKVCHHFAYLGISDEETWYNHIGLKDPRPLMFDKRYQPKPAFFSTRAALEQP